MRAEQRLPFGGGFRPRCVIDGASMWLVNHACINIRPNTLVWYDREYT